MGHPIDNQIGTVFVPVRDIAAARAWYCKLLGLDQPPILFGHLCVLPMRDGSGLALDSKDFNGPHQGKPLFHLDTVDISAAHAYVQDLSRSVGPVTDGVFFTFADPDGNQLMVADVPPPPRSS